MERWWTLGGDTTVILRQEVGPVFHVPATFEMNSGFPKKRDSLHDRCSREGENDGALSWEEEFVRKTVTRQFPFVNLKCQK